MNPAGSVTDCALCADDGGVLIARTPELRIVLVNEPELPGFCRVIWNAHVREMTELAAPEIARVMGAVFAVEDALRTVLRPLKINLASLGNQTPHLHWHVIPRFADDPFFPDSVWAARRREVPAEALVARALQLSALADDIRARLPTAAA